MSYFYTWRPYVPVAIKRLQAERDVVKLKKRGHSIDPVRIAGRTIARSFWGQAWCSNLERYSDYENRLPRGRTYVRNGSVVDLQIARGELAAMVAGSDLYKIKVAITPVGAARWKAICRDCAGTIDSLVELLQGRLDKGVMDRVCRAVDGLFPSPTEIKLSCSCPDWADMCKHVAAVLYGVGARLDERPQLLFLLRGVDANELITGAGENLALSKAAPGSAKILDDSDVAALFGIDMAETGGSDSPSAANRPKGTKRGTKASKVRRAPGEAKTPAPGQNGSRRATPIKPEPKRAAPAPTRKARAQRRRPHPAA